MIHDALDADADVLQLNDRPTERSNDACVAHTSSVDGPLDIRVVVVVVVVRTPKNECFLHFSTTETPTHFIVVVVVRRRSMESNDDGR